VGPVNVIGLDLSLTAPGLAVVGRTETLRTDAKRGDKRLGDIRDWLMHYAATRHLSLAMIEAVPPYDHASSSLERIHGVAREVLARFDVPFAYVNVTALKRFATGNGRADKSDVMAVVRDQWGIDVKDDNASDASVLRVMGEVFLSGVGLLGAGSALILPSLSAIDWPLRPDDPSWPQPYGVIRQKPVRKKCKDGYVSLKNGDHWVHPFNMAVCTKPPK
jgi:crossover junction endodeoxyribonuclease RuvC